MLYKEEETIEDCIIRDLKSIGWNFAEPLVMNDSPSEKEEQKVECRNAQIR